MTCRSCGAEIAANAIVCYRCGAPTAEPASRTAPAGGRRRWKGALVAVAVMLAALWVAVAAPGGPAVRWGAAGAAAVATAAALLLAVRRR